MAYIGTSDIPELRESVDECESDCALCRRTRESVGDPAIEDDEAGVALGLEEAEENQDGSDTVHNRRGEASDLQRDISGGGVHRRQRDNHPNHPCE